MEKKWYYTQGKSEQQGPVASEDIQSMLDAGQLLPTDMIWSEGMADWIPVKQSVEFNLAPGAHAVQAAPASAAAPQHAMGPTGSIGADRVPEGLIGWMTFCAIMLIINGVFYLCSLFTGVFLILAGVSLLAAKNLLFNMHDISPSVYEFLDNLKSGFMMLGIFIIAILVLSILYMLFWIFWGFALFGPIIEDIMRQL